MKKIIFVSLIVSSIAVFTACNNAGKHDGSSTDSTGATASTTNSDNSNAVNDTNNMIGGSAAPTDTSGRTSGNKNTTTNIDKKSIDFIMKAAGGGMMEVELGNIATQKAQDQRVKDFGSMMVADHTQANNELKSLASAKGVTVPATMPAEHQRHIDMLKDKSGAEFDKAYMKMMVDDHKKDVQEFKKASTDSKDTEVKGFASKTLPVLQKHLDAAKAINEKM